jgi:Tfp pilus assembly protein PilF
LSGTTTATVTRDIEQDRTRLRAIHAVLTAGDIGRAGAMAETALADGIEHPMVLDLAAGRLDEQGRSEEALALLLRAKAMAPAAFGIRNAIGLCLQRHDRMEEAAAEFGEAIALNPDFAAAFANRASSLVALSRLVEARRDFERARTLDPSNLVALGGLAALAVRRGDTAGARVLASQVLEREPDFPAAATTLAEVEIAEGHSAQAQARLRRMLGGGMLHPHDRAIAEGLLGDALDTQGRFPEAFAAYEAAGLAFQQLYREGHAASPGPVPLIRSITTNLNRRLSPFALPAAANGPARRHIFLAGFPRSGTTLFEQILEQHPEIATIPEQECLVDAIEAAMGDADRFEAFCTLPERDLQPFRDAYWRRVAQTGVDPAGKIFVDKHPFHSFKLPLIARLFPEATILFAQRDPRDIVLSAFRRRFQLSAPTYQMLTLHGTAALYDAAMALFEATAAAFPVAMPTVKLEQLIADFDGTVRGVCETLGVPWDERLRRFAEDARERGVFTPSAPQIARGINPEGVGKWRDYAAEMAPVMPLLSPWVSRLGYA